MSRKKKLLLNTAAGFMKQIAVTVCGFILPRYMLLYYGSSVNGLVSSVTHFLSFIALLDMGVGAVVQANLYKPLAAKDHEQVSLIVKSSERFFRRLALIFLAYIAVLAVIFPVSVNRTFGAAYSVSLLAIIAISSFAQYLFGMTNQLLLNADQKAYIPIGMQMGTVILNTALSVLLMKNGASVHAVKLMTSTVYLLRPFGQMLYVKKHYRIDKTVKVEGEPIRQKWNGFSQHLASVVCQNIDVVVLTTFSTLQNVSVYSVYYNVTYGVQQVVMTAATGLESLFGSLIANGEKEKLSKAFCAVEWLVHTGVTFIFTVSAIMIVPFVSVYTRGITDISYIYPAFGALLVAAYAAQCLRVPYFRVIKAAGHFKETQNGAYISAVINIVITVAMVARYGLIGAALGTLAAMLYHTCYFAWYLRKHILCRSLAYFVKYLATDLLTAAACFFGSRIFDLTVTGYASWVVNAVKVSFLTAAVTALVTGIFYAKNMVTAFRLLVPEKGKRAGNRKG